MVEMNEKQRKLVKDLAQKYNLELVLLFGSQVSGRTHKESDFDVAVLGKREVAFDEQISLINKFSVIFGKKVDLTVLNRANPLLLFSVSKNALLLFGKKEDFFKFKIHAFNAYNDYAPYFKMERSLNKKIINSYASR